MKAKLLLKNACRVNPNHISAYHALGRLETRLKNVEEARGYFAAADAINPCDVYNLHVRRYQNHK